MFVLPQGWLERALLVVLAVTLLGFLVTGCAAVEMVQDGGGGGNPGGIPWWGWLLIGLGAGLIL